MPERSNSKTAKKYHLRPATQQDASAIRSQVHEAGINPLGLDWRRFIIAVDAHGKVIGCGQVKTHRDGSRELASIAVRPGWRRRGIAHAIIGRLLTDHPGELYLTCREPLGKFYARFGFRVIDQRSQMPTYFRRIALLVSLLRRVGIVNEKLLVMMRPAQDSARSKKSSSFSSYSSLRKNKPAP